MQQTPLGRTGLNVSRLSFGASSLGGVFRDIDDAEARRAVHVALDCGITYFDVAPAYGGTRAETMLGRALRDVPRHTYVLSTKVGKYTNPDAYGDDTLDYSRARIRASIDESAARLGTDYFDLVHLHDIEYQDRRHTEWALDEGMTALRELKHEGRIGAVGMGIYPMDLWHRVLSECDPDAALVHNHYCLNDTQLIDLLPLAAAKGTGLINGSPFASGLLTDRGPAAWHPSGEEERAVFRRASAFCQREGTSLGKVALQFASQHPGIPTTLFSSASPASVRNNVAWHEEPYDPTLVQEIRALLAPVLDREWTYR
jgi:aryl-alcohol dehydrogenase-like predicted oxidoreductase